MKKIFYALFTVAILLSVGCVEVDGPRDYIVTPDRKFHRLYGFFTPANEEEVKILAGLGVKGVSTSTKPENNLYPVFQPHPLYGNRLKIDIAGETCAWYRLWDIRKVENYAKTIRAGQHRYHKTTECVPFIGFSANGLIDKKDVARVEQELLAILKSDSDALMVHELRSVLKVPEVLAVFQKYCSAECKK